MLVLANDKEHYHLLLKRKSCYNKVLKHYFPGEEENTINLNTKYYSADIKLTHRHWPSLQDIKDEDEEKNKHDLMVMIATPEQSHPA